MSFALASRTVAVLATSLTRSLGFQTAAGASAHHLTRWRQCKLNTVFFSSAAAAHHVPVDAYRLFAEPQQVIPTFGIMQDPTAAVIAPSTEPGGEPNPVTRHPALAAAYTAEWCRDIYAQMVLLSTFDRIMYDAQRQGRVSFYMTSLGEEATVIGSAAALARDNRDVVFAQYREAGVLLHRGFPLEAMMHQCFSNMRDLCRGRQMPIHYGSRAHNFHTVSSPLCTQLPQAVGAAYALKLEKLPDADSTMTKSASDFDGVRDDRIVICYFGEGAASEGDFHAAMLLASTSQSPIIFFCRNNGYAISTPASEQYRGDGIAGRGLGYGIRTIRVDGNDVFAVHHATLEARRYAASNSAPVLIEAMTYRVGHHSTSDDSSLYRPKKEVEEWTGASGSPRCPLVRLRGHMQAQGWWPTDKLESDAEEKKLRDDVRKRVLSALGEAENVKRTGFEDMFNDVYESRTPALAQQLSEIKAVVAKYPNMFPLHMHSEN